jgi:hypothetical protein
LSGNAVLSYVSDNYILVHEIRPGPCGIYVFDRTGKIVSHFNHKGQSGREYTWIGGTIFDEKNEEIFVCAQSIQVYSLNGEYKRTLKINTIQNELKVFNFDDETLLVYEDVIINSPTNIIAKKNPYSLISKKDGSTVSVLDIHLPERYSTRIPVMEDNNKFRIIFKHYTSSMYYGQDFMLADISSDTLYLLTQNRELTPILTRNPSVHTSDSRLVWFTLLTTDKFVLIGTIPLISNSRGGRIPVFMYEFETGEISNVSFSDAENAMKDWTPGASPAIAKNMTANLISAPSIVEAYKMKRLKGNYEKIAAAVDEDDNQIVRVIKFK